MGKNKIELHEIIVWTVIIVAIAWTVIDIVIPYL